MQGGRAQPIRRSVMPYIFKRQGILAFAALSLACSTSNLEKRNTVWCASLRKLLTPLTPPTFSFAALILPFLFTSHSRARCCSAASTTSYLRSVWHGAGRTDTSVPFPLQGVQCLSRALWAFLMPVNAEGTCRTCSGEFPAPRCVRRSRLKPRRVPDLAVSCRANAVSSAALISHSNPAQAQWKFCLFCAFRSQLGLPRFLAQAAALSPPEIVRKEHPWHRNAAAEASLYQWSQGDAAHVGVEAPSGLYHSKCRCNRIF